MPNHCNASYMNPVVYSSILSLDERQAQTSALICETNECENILPSANGAAPTAGIYINSK